jgi:hypothetical protein
MMKKGVAPFSGGNATATTNATTSSPGSREFDVQ